MSNPLSPNCRYCHHYQPEGRRGGHCQRLGAMVKGEWQSCSLVIPTFAPSNSKLESAMSTFVAEPEFFSYVAPTLAFTLESSGV